MNTIIIASASPRRKEILENHGIPFKIEVSDVDESHEKMHPAKLVEELSKRKAKAVFQKFPSEIVLGADTVVALDGRIYGKPQDKAEAREMLKALSGRVHEVLTGIAWVKDGHTFSEVVTTNVKFAQLAETEIDRYIESGEPMDKAGAYALQGKAAVFIEGIEGSYTNVVGLPLYATAALGRRAGVDIYGTDDDYGQRFAH